MKPTVHIRTRDEAILKCAEQYGDGHDQKPYDSDVDWALSCFAEEIVSLRKRVALIEEKIQP